jgi:hypothetical protein
MATNNDNPKGGSQRAMGNKPDREFDSQGTNKGFDKQGQRAGNPGKSSGSPANSDDDEMSTAGGRQGQFSDKDRANQGQWSPGSGESQGG